RLIVRPKVVYAGAWVGGSEYHVQAPTPSNVGSWVYWALVRSGSSLTVYRNGSAVASIATLPAGSVGLSGTIGALGNSYLLHGNIDELAIYNTALSATQIGNHYGASPFRDPVIATAGDIACETDDPNFNGGIGTSLAC